MKSIKDANWGGGGVICLLFSQAVLVIYFVTGELPSKGDIKI
jgi:hypothetical protein